MLTKEDYMKLPKERLAELWEAAKDYCHNLIGEGTFGEFVAHKAGSKWADEHPHWISVEDKLPPTSDKDDESDDYLIVDSDGDKNVGYYNKMDKLWFSCDGYILDVTHWMPLPEIPHHFADVSQKVKKGVKNES